MVDEVLFIETSEFTRRLQSYLDDDGYAARQVFLADLPDAGHRSRYRRNPKASVENEGAGQAGRQPG